MKIEKLNRKGFTLVELIATMAILAVIMLLAVPNVVGIVQKNKNKTYVEDAKKMVVMAKYKIKTDTKLSSTLNSGSSANLCLSYLDKANEISSAPNGGSYERNKSYVIVTKSGDGVYSYTVQLIENKDGTLHGLSGVSNDALSNDTAVNSVRVMTSASDCSGSFK